jgi:hypothetical protein
VTDYRRFLAAPVREVWPCFGGPYVDTGARRLRLSAPAASGYWLLEVTGRSAHPVEPAEAPDLSGLPAVRGYAIADYLVSSGAMAERLAIRPPDEPLPFAPVVARRWPSGELLFDGWDFESGVEDVVRGRFERRGNLAEVKGASAALRAAFGYAVLLRVGAEAGIPVRPAEARGRLAMLADHGEPAAWELLRLLRTERTGRTGRTGHTEQTEQTEPVEVRPLSSEAVVRPSAERATVRAADALHAAGAGLRACRALAGNQLEVRYVLDGENFMSIVDTYTLQVYDAGICLDGTDRELTLESLPSVIREAIRTGQLCITSW